MDCIHIITIYIARIIFKFESSLHAPKNKMADFNRLHFKMQSGDCKLYIILSSFRATRTFSEFRAFFILYLCRQDSAVNILQEEHVKKDWTGRLQTIM